MKPDQLETFENQPQPEQRHQDHINAAMVALGAMTVAAGYLDSAATAAINADTELRLAAATLDDLKALTLLEALRVGALDGSNKEIRDAQERGYRAASADWTEAASAYHDATVAAARARQKAESAAARFSVAKEGVRLHTSIVALLGRGL